MNYSNEFIQDVCMAFGQTYQWGRHCVVNNLHSDSIGFDMSHCFGINLQSGGSGLSSGIHIGVCVGSQVDSSSLYFNVGGESTVGLSHSSWEYNADPIGGSVNYTSQSGVLQSVGGFFMGTGVEFSNFTGSVISRNDFLTPQPFDYKGFPPTSYSYTPFNGNIDYGSGSSFHIQTFEIPRYDPPKFDFPTYNHPSFDTPSFSSSPLSFGGYEPSPLPHFDASTQYQSHYSPAFQSNLFFGSM